MGVVVRFESAPASLWPCILARLGANGICIQEQGKEEGLLWCSCRRGWVGIGLCIEPAKAVENVTLYCGALRYWWRPLATDALFGAVLSVIRLTASQAVP